MTPQSILKFLSNKNSFHKFFEEFKDFFFEGKEVSQTTEEILDSLENRETFQTVIKELIKKKDEDYEEFIIFLLSQKYSNLMEAYQIQHFEFSDEFSPLSTDVELDIFSYFLEEIYQLVDNSSPYLKAKILIFLISINSSDRALLEEFFSLIPLIDDREKQKILFYELFQNLSQDEPFETLELLKNIKEKFPDEDWFYEINGHIGIEMLEYDELVAIKNFEEVYQWLNYRFLADIPEENLSSNFILFMAVYVLLLMSDEKLEKARDVLHFTYSILQPILKQEKEFFDESTYENVIDNYISQLLYAHVSLIKKIQKLDNETAYHKAIKEIQTKNLYLPPEYSLPYDYEDLENRVIFKF